MCNDNHQHPPPFTWAWLNADTLFLGFLVLLGGIFDLVDPYRDVVVEFRDFAGPLFYVRAGSYVLAGALLVASLVLQSVPTEAIARGLLIGGVALNAYRHAYFLGWDTTTVAYLVFLALTALTAYMRMKVLLGSTGLLVSRDADPSKAES